MKGRPLISRAIVAAVCLAALLGTATIASACPSCQQALANDESAGDLARGIYYSVVFMMSMPFAIVGTFAGLMYRAVKREQQRVAQASGAASSNTASSDTSSSVRQS
jgi:hypothetical protein